MSETELIKFVLLHRSRQNLTKTPKSASPLSKKSSKRPQSLARSPRLSSSLRMNSTWPSQLSNCMKLDLLFLTTIKSQRCSTWKNLKTFLTIWQTALATLKYRTTLAVKAHSVMGSFLAMKFLSQKRDRNSGALARWVQPLTNLNWESEIWRQN